MGYRSSDCTEADEGRAGCPLRQLSAAFHGSRMQKEARKASVAWHLAASGCQRMLAMKDHEGASQSFRALCNLCRAKHGLIRGCYPFASLLAQERALTFALSTPRCPQDMACLAQYGQIADWLGLHPNEFTRNTFIHVAPKHSNLRRCQSEGPPSQFACKTPVGIRLGCWEGGWGQSLFSTSALHVGTVASPPLLLHVRQVWASLGVSFLEMPKNRVCLVFLRSAHKFVCARSPLACITFISFRKLLDMLRGMRGAAVPVTAAPLYHRRCLLCW